MRIAPVVITCLLVLVGCAQQGPDQLRAAPTVRDMCPMLDPDDGDPYYDAVGQIRQQPGMPRLPRQFC